MALSDVEAIVFAKSDDVIAEAVKQLNKVLENDYRAFTSRIYGGVLFIIIGVILAILPQTLPALSILVYAGIGVIVLGVVIIASAFMLKTRIETASLKLYPILFAGFEHGEFFAIDPFGNGDNIVLLRYNLDDISKAFEKFDELQKLYEESYQGKIETTYEVLEEDGKTIVLSKPLKILYEESMNLLDIVKNIRIEEKTYNMIFPEESDVPHDILIPLERSGFSEDLSLKKITIDEIDKLFEELVSTSRNWEDIVDKLKELREKLAPLYGQIVSHYKWFRDNASIIIPGSLRDLRMFYTYICPRCLLARNYFADPSYPTIGLIHVKEDEETKAIYQCPQCGYTSDLDELYIPIESLKHSLVDNFFNEFWLGLYNYNRSYIDNVINTTSQIKKDILNKLHNSLSQDAEKLSREIEEFINKVDLKIMDIKVYTDLLERVGLEGVQEIYKAIYENTEYMKKTLLETPSIIKELLLDLLKIRVDPLIFNNTYLELRKQAAEKIGRIDLIEFINSEYESLEYEKLVKLYSPLVSMEEIMEKKEEKVSEEEEVVEETAEEKEEKPSGEMVVEQIKEGEGGK